MSDELRGLSRRQLIARLGAASVVALPGAARAETAAASPARRDLADPDLVSPQLLWDKLLTPDELATVGALCDVILPGDERSPAPSAVAVPDFIDEWVSAPYPTQTQDRQLIRGGLAWLNTEAQRRFDRRFVELSALQKTAICDDIADEKKASVRLRVGARFFDRVRYLTLVGFFTTVEGMKDLGYVGNVALTEWKGPPDAILKRLGLL
jgi:gluconate 2-dehydrogenase gamma chain